MKKLFFIKQTLLGLLIFNTITHAANNDFLVKKGIYSAMAVGAALVYCDACQRLYVQKAQLKLSAKELIPVSLDETPEQRNIRKEEEVRNVAGLVAVLFSVMTAALSK